jgi:hypothetical protein
MKKITQVIKNWLYAPSFLELSILYFLLGFYIAVATDVVVSSIWFNVVLVSLSATVVFYTFRVITFAIVLSKKALDFWSRWIHLMFIAIMLILIFKTNVAIILRLRLSESALSKKVQFIQSLPLEQQDNWLNVGSLAVGFFNIRLEKVDNSNRTIWFHTADGEDPFGPMSLIGGIVYCPKEYPPELGETTYQHLYGPWWSWVQDI